MLQLFCSAHCVPFILVHIRLKSETLQAHNIFRALMRLSRQEETRQWPDGGEGRARERQDASHGRTGSVHVIWGVRGSL